MTLPEDVLNKIKFLKNKGKPNFSSLHRSSVLCNGNNKIEKIKTLISKQKHT